MRERTRDRGPYPRTWYDRLALSRHDVRDSARAFVALILFGLAFSSEAWWSPQWTQRKLLAIDTSTTGANTQADISDAPVLVRLHAGNFPQFFGVRDAGLDFRFLAADDQTPLAYHIEQFDPVTQIALAWVKYPTLNGQARDQRLYLYFGNASAVKGEASGATYDAATAAVYHFSQPAGVEQDATAYATPLTGEFIANPASIIGTGALLSGTATLQIADAPQLLHDPAKGFTIELWARFDTLPAAAVTVFERGSGNAQLALELNAGQLTVSHAGVALTSSTPILAGSWHHLAVVLDAATLTLYVDGQPAANAPVQATALSGTTRIGGSADGSRLAAFALDELRLSTVARSADEIAFAAAVEGSRNDAVMTYGGDETAAQADAAAGTAKPAGHFAIIFRNVFGNRDAIVEQAVIGLCGVMAAVALLVMLLKAVALGRNRRGTRRFLAAYQTLTADAAAELGALIDDEDDYIDSPLFNIYRQGLGEVRTRRSPAVGAAAVGLDHKSMGAIRATLDAVLVREGQRMNSQLVLLTIAISGGPFIGLLGTVVGVMVTFATIAATGDVNIAAIAPGMAAALLATVAGLGVAIPSLFGYNYLSSMARDINADMHVFTDEFVARLNERYGA